MPEVRADGVAIYVYRRTPLFEFLQVKRTLNTGEYQQTWQTVYGGVEPGETAVQAALRELKEETALVPAKMWQVEYIETFYFMPHDYVLMMPVFAVEVPPSAPIQLNSEHDEFRWITEPRIENAFMWRTQREALAVILHMLKAPTPAIAHLTVKTE
ncbi:MAG TPA: NUDIX domain-containing protein [Phycisphaerae bacterium]|jgi:dATP pyrophosphohydrolase